MKVFTSIPLCIAALLVTSPLHAAQGVLITQTTTINGAPRATQVQIEPTRMRTEVAAPDGTLQVVIFDGTKQVMQMLSPAAKTYREMTKAEVDAAGAQIQGAMAQMQKALENMPPAQRAQVEALMKGRGMPGAGSAAAKSEYRRAGTAKVGKWTCDVYEAYLEGQRSGEVCTVAPASLGFMPADFEVSRQLGAFLKGLLPQGAEQVFQAGRVEEQGFNGVPVRSVTTIAGRQIVTELTDVKRQTFADADFQVPAGFTRQASPFGGRARGRGPGAQP